MYFIYARGTKLGLSFRDTQLLRLLQRFRPESGNSLIFSNYLAIPWKNHFLVSSLARLFAAKEQVSAAKQPRTQDMKVFLHINTEGNCTDFYLSSHLFSFHWWALGVTGGLVAAGETSLVPPLGFLRCRNFSCRGRAGSAYAGCPLCHLWLLELIKRYQKIREGSTK